MKKSNLLKLITVMLVLTLSVVLFACNSNNYNIAPEESGKSDADVGEGTVVIGQTDRKIVYYVTMEMYADDTTALGDTIKTQTVEKGGYMEGSSESTNNKYVYYRYILRIPTEKLDAFLTSVESGGTVNSKTVTTTDITTQYVSAQANIEALESERAALNKLLENATLTSDVIAISKRISEINASLGALEKEINNYDSLIDYSTVTINVYKTQNKPADSRNFGEKLGDLLVKSFKSIGTAFKGLLIGLTAAFPYILMLGAVATIVIFVLIVVHKKKGKRLKYKKESLSVEKNEISGGKESIEENNKENKDGI